MDFHFTKHPMQVLAGMTGAKRITMTPSHCVALSYLLEAAANGIERGDEQNRQARIARSLREHAATWRVAAAERV